MKTFRSTLIFALVVAGLVGYAVFEMKRGEEKQAAEAKQDRIFHVDEKDVQELQIVRPDGSLRLVREQDALVLKAPVEDRTEGFAATSYLNSILNETAKVLEEKNQQWSDYGLDQPLFKVEVTSTKGDKTTYQLGSEQAYDGSYYLREGDRLLIGSTAWKGLLSKSVNDIREKKLFHLGGKVKSVRLQSPQEKVDLKLVSRDGKWFYDKDEKMVLDSQAVERYISDITNYRASDFVAEDTSPTMLAKYGLNKPQLTLELWMENENSESPQWWLKVAKSGVDTYAYYSGRSTIYKVPGDTMQRLSKDLESLRDKKAPFEFKSDQVKELSLHTRLTDIRLVKKDGQWAPLEPTPGKEVDQTAVETLLSKLSSLETRYYLGKKKGRGLGDAQTNLVKLGDGKGQPIFEMKWGDSFKAKNEIKSATDEDLYYTHTSLASELLGVSTSKIDELPRQTLLKSISSSKEPESKGPGSSSGAISSDGKTKKKE